PGRRRRGDLLPLLRRGGRDPRGDAARVRAEHGGEVSAMARSTAGTTAAAPAEQVKDLADLPSFPALYAAALDPRSAATRRRARDFDHLMGGPATDLVHPGVLHVLAFPLSLALMARRDFPFALLGLVHLRNQVLQHRPVQVGELVDVECRVRGLRPHRKGRTFEAVSTILGEDGEIIATDVSTYLVRGDAPSAGEPSGTAPSAGSAPREREEFVPPRPTGRWALP